MLLFIHVIFDTCYVWYMYVWYMLRFDACHLLIHITSWYTSPLDTCTVFVWYVLKCLIKLVQFWNIYSEIYDFEWEFLDNLKLQISFEKHVCYAVALNSQLACNFFQPNHTKNFSLRIQICSSQTVALNFQLACKVFQPCEILIQVFVFPFLVHTFCYFELLAHSGMKSQKEETRLEQALLIFHTSDGKVDHSWATFENSANLTHWTSARNRWARQTCCEPS